MRQEKPQEQQRDHGQAGVQKVGRDKKRHFNEYLGI